MKQSALHKDCGVTAVDALRQKNRQESVLHWLETTEVLTMTGLEVRGQPTEHDLMENTQYE